MTLCTLFLLLMVNKNTIDLALWSILLFAIPFLPLFSLALRSFSFSKLLSFVALFPSPLFLSFTSLLPFPSLPSPSRFPGSSSLSLFPLSSLSLLPLSLLPLSPPPLSSPSLSPPLPSLSLPLLTSSLSSCTPSPSLLFLKVKKEGNKEGEDGEERGGVGGEYEESVFRSICRRRRRRREGLFKADAVNEEGEERIRPISPSLPTTALLTGASDQPPLPLPASSPPSSLLSPLFSHPLSLPGRERSFLPGGPRERS